MKIFYRNSRTFLLLIFIGFIGACAAKPVLDSDWPSALPPKAHYDRLYDMDISNHTVQTRDKYLYWVVKFYEGYNAIDGWQQISKNILNSVQPKNYRIVSAKLDYIGRLVSGEWAKLSPERVIVNKTVGVWSQAANQAALNNDIEPFIDNMLVDVEALFAKKLTHQEITLERYYQNNTDEIWLE